MKVFLQGHLGMGDIIMYNGLVRMLRDHFEEVIVPTRFPLSKSVERLYDFDDGIKIEVVMGDYECRDVADAYALKGYKILDGTDKVIDTDEYGADNPGIGSGFCAYWEAKYSMLNSWTNFFFDRNKAVEEDVYDYVVGDSKEDYAFVQVNTDRLNPEAGTTEVNLDLLPKDIRIIQAFIHDEIPIVDYLKVIKNAKVIHVMDSSFACLIDRCFPKQENKYNHKYMRWLKQKIRPTMMLGDWKLHLGENPELEKGYQDYNRTLEKYFGETNARTDKFGVELW